MKRIVQILKFFALISLIVFSSCSKKNSEANSDYIGEKAPTSPKVVGDIIFNDGSATSYQSIKARKIADSETNSKITKVEKEAAIAVVFYVGNELNDNDKTLRTLGVGLKHERNGIKWCSYTSETDKANAYSENIQTIQCLSSGNAGALTFDGVKNGNQNLEKISQYMILNNIVDDTTIAEKYPAFYFAKNYSSAASNLANYNSNWYLPSIAELYGMWQNLETVDTAIELCGGDKIGSSYYWSSSQYASKDNNALYMDFYYGDAVIAYKDDDNFYACAIKAF